MSTAVDLAEALAAASAMGDGDVVVDLSEVQFMDAAIITEIVRGGHVLRLQSRALMLRAPSRFARRLLDVCGLVWSVDPVPAVAVRVIPRAASGPPSAVPSAPNAGTI